MVKHLLESMFCSHFCVRISVNTPDHSVSLTSEGLFLCTYATIVEVWGCNHRIRKFSG